MDLLSKLLQGAASDIGGAISGGEQAAGNFLQGAGQAVQGAVQNVQQAFSPPIQSPLPSQQTMPQAQPNPVQSLLSGISSQAQQLPKELQTIVSNTAQGFEKTVGQAVGHLPISELTANVHFSPVGNPGQFGVGPFTLGQQAPPPADVHVGIPQSIQNIPVVGGLANIGAGIVQNTINTIPHYLQAQQSFNQMASGQAPITPQSLLSNAAKQSELPLMALGGGEEGMAAKAVAENPTVRNLLMAGVENIPKTTAIMGGFGLASGLSQPASNIITQLKQGGVSGVAGALSGIPMSFLGPGLAFTGGKISQQVNKAVLDAFSNSFQDLSPETRSNPVVAALQPALNIADNVSKGINGAISTLKDNINDRFANKQLNDATSNYLPQFNTLPIQDKANIWDNILTLKDGNVPSQVTPALMPALNLVRNDILQSGKINFGAEVLPKEEPPIAQQVEDLQNTVNQKQSENQTRAQIARETRSLYSDSQLQDIAQLKRLYGTSKAFQEGDIETIRASQHAPLLERVLSAVRENTPITDDTQAMQEALSMPTKADTTVSRVPEIQQLKEAQAQYKLEQQRFEQEFGRPATASEQQQMLRDSSEAMFNQLGATKELPDELKKQRMELEASMRNPGNRVYSLVHSDNVNDLLKGGKYAVNRGTVTGENGELLGQLPKRSNPNILGSTENTVDLPIKGNTETERVKSAIANSEYVKNLISTKGKDAYRAGLKLTPEDIKLSEQYQHGMSIDAMAKQAVNSKAFTDYMNKYVDYYDTELAADRASGGSTPTRANYMPQTWDLSKPEDLQRFNTLVAQKGIRPWDGYRSQPRVFNTYAEGEAAGFTRLRPNTLQDLKAHYLGASEAISKQALRLGLQTATPDHVSITGNGIDENGKPFVNSNIKGIEGMSYTKNVHNLLKGYEKSGITQTAETFREKGFLQGAKEEGVLPTVGWLYDHASTGLKQTLLNLSFFHDVNVGLGNVGGSAFGRTIRGLVTLSPEEVGKGIKLGVNVIRSIPSLFSEDFVRTVDEQFQSKMVKGQNYSVYDAIQKSGSSLDRGLPAETKMAKYNLLQSTARATFDRYLHVLKLHLGEAIFGDGKIDPTSPQGHQAGQELDLIMGQINNRTMNKSEGGALGTKTLSRAFLAPQFTISKLQTLLDSVSKGGPQGTIARDAVIGKSLLFGTLSTLSTLLATGKYPTLQKILLNYTFNPSIQTDMKNPNGKKVSFGFPATYTSELGRPGYETITNPNHLAGIEQYAQARLNPFLTMIQAAATNKDYYGNPIIDPNSGIPLPVQIGKGVLQGKLPIGLQQIALQAEGKQNTAESIANILGLRAHVSSSDPTSKYFNNRDQVINSITDPKVQNAVQLYLSMPQTNPNTSAIKDMLLQDPKVYAAVQQIMKANGTNGGTDPIFSSDAKTVHDYLTYETLNKTAPGSAEEKQFLKNHADVLPMIQARQSYYAANPIPQKPGAIPFIPPPQASAYVQQQLTAKNYNDPQVQQYLNAHSNYVNGERAKAGLDPIDTYGNIQGSKNYGVSFGGSSGSIPGTARRGIQREERYTSGKVLKPLYAQLTARPKTTISMIRQPSMGKMRALHINLLGHKGKKMHTIKQTMSLAKLMPKRSAKLPLPKKLKAKNYFGFANA